MASRNASKLGDIDAAAPACRMPTSGGFDSCDRVANGQLVKAVTSVPPSSVMNSRRLIASASSEAEHKASYRLQPAVRKGSDVPGPMSALLPRHRARAPTNVRYASNRWGNRPALLWIAEDFGCCASG